MGPAHPPSPRAKERQREVERVLNSLHTPTTMQCPAGKEAGGGSKRDAEERGTGTAMTTRSAHSGGGLNLRKERVLGSRWHVAKCSRARVQRASAVSLRLLWLHFAP